MSLDLLLAIAGVAVTAMVIVGMVLIVPSGVESAPRHLPDPPQPDAEVAAEADAGEAAEPVRA